MTEPSWDLYRSLLAVLQTGSLSAAARALGLTQPTIGRHVEALEDILGQQLFTRSQQGLLPTEAALALKPFAEVMATTSAALLRATTEDRDRIGGTVRISASEVVGIEVLPPILAELQERHPDLIIELSTTDTIEDILHREADIAVRMAPPSQDALLARRIGAIPLGLHAHKRYLDRYGVPDTMAALSQHRFIGYDQQTAFVRAMGERFPFLRELHMCFRADSNIAQLAAIRAGLGLGFCQLALVKDDPDIQHVVPELKLSLETWVAMHEDLRSSPRCRAVFDALVAGLLAYIGTTD